VIMRLNFEGDFVFIVKVNDASIIHKSRDDPGRVDLVRADLR